MTGHALQDVFPGSPAYRELQPLRVPSGWRIDWNTLYVGLEADPSGAGGSSIFNATNPGRRYNIDVEYRPEFDPKGSYHLTVLYQPWSRTERGRRRQDLPFALGAEAETVHAFETRAYSELVAELERWIARCTVWIREGH